MQPRLPPIEYRDLNPGKARRAGVVLVILGLFLTLLAAAIVAFFFELFSLGSIIPGVYRDPAAGPTKVSTGTWVFISFFAMFGLVSLVHGVWMIWFGRRQKLLTVITIGMAIIFIVAGIWARAYRPR